MTTARRIAFVSPRFSPEGTVGGAETLLKALAEQAAAAGRDITFLTTCAKDHFTWNNVREPGTETVNGMTVHYFPVDESRDIEVFLKHQNRIDRRIPLSREEEEAWVDNSVNSPALYDHLRTYGDRYDRILVGPYLFGITLKVARIHPEKTWLVPCLHDEPFAYLAVIQDLFEQVGGFIFNTRPEQALAERLYRQPSAKGTVVGIGLEPFEADASAFARKHSITTPYVLYAGRRETLKGTPLLTQYVQVFRERTGREITLVFTGSGDIDAPDALRPHMLDVGFVSEQEKHEAMAGATAFIHPSVNESLGIVLLEAWLARTPVLVHAAGHVLTDQCRRSGGGLWFRVYPEFEEMLSYLLDHPDIAARMGDAGRDFVLREYTWDAVLRRLFQAIDTTP
ncbi:MAG: glycosyltransferase family 4 protein [Verrucomicrobia bacterium]|nr:glycosyltransferase family 4 protein [Verrucomicrobiota bacterium]